MPLLNFKIIEVEKRHINAAFQNWHKISPKGPVQSAYKVTGLTKPKGCA